MSGSEWFDKLSEAVDLLILSINEFDALEDALFMDEFTSGAITTSGASPSHDDILAVTRRAHYFKKMMDKNCGEANSILTSLLPFSSVMTTFTRDESYISCKEAIGALNYTISRVIDKQYQSLVKALADPVYSSTLLVCRAAYLELKVSVSAIKKVTTQYNSHHINDGLSLPDVVLPKLIWPRFSFIRSLLMFCEVYMTDSDKKWFDALILAARYATSAILDFVGFEAELAMDDMFTSEFTSSSKAPSPIDADRIHEITAKASDFRVEMEKYCDKIRIILAGVARLTPTLHNFTDDVTYKACSTRIKSLLLSVNQIDILYDSAMQVLVDPEYVHSLEAFKTAASYCKSLITAIKNAVDDYNSHHKTDDLFLPTVVLPKW